MLPKVLEYTKYGFTPVSELIQDISYTIGPLVE